jgi:hypothetical protein
MGHEKRGEVSDRFMTNRLEMDSLRHVVCSRCGTEFSCAQSEKCWCAEEAARLPTPREGEDCLCRECLRQAAAQVLQEQQAR